MSPARFHHLIWTIRYRLCFQTSEPMGNICHLNHHKCLLQKGKLKRNRALKDEPEITHVKGPMKSAEHRMEICSYAGPPLSLFHDSLRSTRKVQKRDISGRILRKPALLRRQLDLLLHTLKFFFLTHILHCPTLIVVFFLPGIMLSVKTHTAMYT